MKKRKDKSFEGESEENVYGQEAREDLIESDEISAEEEGFMSGYDEATEDSESEDDSDDEEEDEERY
jgi:hypothetical protein